MTRRLPLEQIAERYRAGATYAEIARDYDCAAETIRRRLRDAGLLGPRNNVPPQPPRAHWDFQRPDWMDHALCNQTDPELFFPELGGSTKQAKALCLSCEVRAECLDYALDHEEQFGVWGGLSEHERRRLLRRATA